MEYNDYNIIKSVLIMGAALMYLWNVMLLLMGRRITRGDGLLLANVIAILLGYNLLIENVLAPPIIIIGTLGIWLLVRYFRGVNYNVYADNKKMLVEELEKAIKDLEGNDFEKIVEEKTIKYKITGTRKSIELIENKPFFAFKKNYYIKFKRWNDFWTKKEILSTLDNVLQEEEVDGRAKVKLIVRIILGIIFVILTTGLAVESVMEPDELPQWILENPPVKIYLVEKDKYYANEEIYPQLQQVIEKAYTSKSSVDRTEEEMMGNADVILYYQREDDGENAMLYMRRYNGVLFIPDSVMASSSLFHRIMAEIHQIYDQGNGAYFELSYYESPSEKGWRGLVEEMINSAD